MQQPKIYTQFNFFFANGEDSLKTEMLKFSRCHICTGFWSNIQHITDTHFKMRSFLIFTVRVRNTMGVSSVRLSVSSHGRGGGGGFPGPARSPAMRYPCPVTGPAGRGTLVRTGVLPKTGQGYPPPDRARVTLSGQDTGNPPDRTRVHLLRFPAG